MSIIKSVIIKNKKIICYVSRDKDTNEITFCFHNLDSSLDSFHIVDRHINKNNLHDYKIIIIRTKPLTEYY